MHSRGPWPRRSGGVDLLAYVERGSDHAAQTVTDPRHVLGSDDHEVDRHVHAEKLHVDAFLDLSTLFHAGLDHQQRATRWLAFRLANGTCASRPAVWATTASSCRSRTT